MLSNSNQGQADLRRRVMANNVSDARFRSSGPNASANLQVPQPNYGMIQPAPHGPRNDFISRRMFPNRFPPSVAISEPPLEIRRLVEETALLISKNGLEIERKVMALNINDARFNFMWSSDPYHAFYHLKLTNYRAQNQGGAQVNQYDAPASHERVVGEAQLHLKRPQHLSTQMQPGTLVHPPPVIPQFPQFQVFPPPAMPARMFPPPPLPLHDLSELAPEVKENKFFAQQPCSSTIGDDWEVIDIPVQSFLERLANWEMQIPANK
ncbi:PREDICTED: probable splicing factor 3A subunit 1 [Camelina sativa]|uniref:Probable splicing factor 3A subunit 1 n=1 Tax=Camelina sativa TaxID=90675 RepID=A0ABM0V8M8_CAMSA|nr:PREDICTED: probable splicing factor 3A subunit 1 [Camelina sativa]